MERSLKLPVVNIVYIKKLLFDVFPGEKCVEHQIIKYKMSVR